MGRVVFVAEGVGLRHPPFNGRRLLKYFLHLGALFAAFVAAYELRRGLPLEWWLQDPLAAQIFWWAGLYALIGAVTEMVFQSERTAWQFVSVREALAIARNVSVTVGLLLAVLFLIDRGIRLPRLVLVLAWLLSIAFLVGMRLAWRLRHDGALLRAVLPFGGRRIAPDRKPLLVVGAMKAADVHLRHLAGDAASSYAPAGIVTPNANEVGFRLHGVPVLRALGEGRERPDLAGLVPHGGQPCAILFLEEPIRALGFTAAQIGELRRRGHVLLRPLRLTEMGGASAIGTLREIPLEEFLPRQPIALDPDPVRALVEGRRVLVTGAGGSIGSEIARQLIALGCAELTLIDHSEYLLFEIDRELSRSAAPARRRAVLANIRNRERIGAVFAAARPEIVFHAAALKHVGLVENNPSEGVLTNVLGTRNVLEAAVAAGAAQFVLISTDKAADPSNVMGATKRTAEALLELHAGADTRLCAVRFGNVLGSAGSVVPIFRDQIARGGPVTVTHPQVDRFFMTIPEAVQLVLHSAALTARGPVGLRKFLLEMGEPVRIVDLARQMIRLAGRTPDVDIAIQFTGLKPGEKLSEVLSDEGEEVTPCIEGIMEVRARAAGRLDAGEVDALIAAARADDAAQATRRLHALVAGITRTGEAPAGDAQAPAPAPAPAPSRPAPARP